MSKRKVAEKGLAAFFPKAPKRTKPNEEVEPADGPDQNLDTSSTVDAVPGPAATPSAGGAGEISQYRWSLHGSLIKTTYTPANTALPLSTPLRVAAFDLDSTIVRTKSNVPWPRDAEDWTWNFTSTPAILRALVSADEKLDSKYKTAHGLGSQFAIVIVSNQGSTVPKEDTKRYVQLKARIRAIATSLDIPIRFYFAAKVAKGQPNPYRKPETGMWDALLKDLREAKGGKGEPRDLVDMDNSFFCGDAMGRKGDFSDSDKAFAANVGLKSYTPEELFQPD